MELIIFLSKRTIQTLGTWLGIWRPWIRCLCLVGTMFIPRCPHPLCNYQKTGLAGWLVLCIRQYRWLILEDMTLVIPQNKFWKPPRNMAFSRFQTHNNFLFYCLYVYSSSLYVPYSTIYHVKIIWNYRHMIISNHTVISLLELEKIKKDIRFRWTFVIYHGSHT